MAEARVTNPLVEQFRRGGVSRDLRLVAAQGLLPLKPEDLLELWADLLGDADAEVRQASTASLSGFAAAELLPVLKSRDAPAPVLSWALNFRPERELRESVLQNPSLPDEAVEAVAASLSENLAELVVINQTRLLRSHPLLVALESNPSLSADQRRRLRELRESFHIEDAREPAAAAPAAPAATAPAPPVSPVPAVPEEAPAAPVPAEEEAPHDEAEAVARYLSPEEQQDPDKVSKVQKIYLMNTFEKLQTALKGSRTERAILIRDSNRLVAAAVIGSPSLTEPEIEAFAAMRNVSDEILRKIGQHREWTRRYAVVNNLVRNPRTPIGIALNLVPHLNPRDIKGVAIDRNVPDAVRKHALKFVRGSK
ncbi:MAG TPA: hypothetical protein VEQ10_02090 [Vicinamibacteria bacterium]|nr:hypothetical protein [Vicinamibacteria bacterium]